MEKLGWRVGNRVGSWKLREMSKWSARNDQRESKIAPLEPKVRHPESSYRITPAPAHPWRHTPYSLEMVYAYSMGRTNIVIDDDLVRKARKLTRLKTKREIVDKALELLVRSESRKGLLRHYGTGIWKGDLKAMRRKRG